MASELLGWCVVANVAEITQHGPGGGTTQTGTRHFSAGTKVWVMPPQWGDGGENVMVLGKHRGRPGGQVRMVLPRLHLTNFRVEPVYSPSVLKDLQRPLRDDAGPRARTWASREEASETASHWTGHDPPAAEQLN